MQRSNSSDVRVAIIGTGFGGIGTAIRLKQAGVKDFVLLERASEVGGVWRDNIYPGAACDVESHLYSFSFAPNPSWSHAFSAQPEILAYVKRCVATFGLRPFIRFNHDVCSATWDETAARWRLTTSQGDYTASVLVLATGALSEPAIPALPGLNEFAGTLFHSARWDASYDLRGRSVAVVGTGASAIQFVPRIQPLVSKLYLFQRTPPWILPRGDRPLSARERWLCRYVPFFQRVLRARIYMLRELEGVGFRQPKLMAAGEHLARRHLEKHVADPALCAKLTPHYTMGCKRILISDDYYPAITQPNVELITTGIRQIRADSLVDHAGIERHVDAIIFGTGFQVTDFPFCQHVRGRDGRVLTEQWAGSPRAHLGTTVAGFPNLFILQGPNTGLGHTSVIYMIEAQINHLVRALRYMMRHKVAAIEPRPEAQEAFVAEVDHAMQGTVWTAGGCQSWYLDRNGRNSTLWPGTTHQFRRRIARFQPGDYRLSR